jgi:hypothetical protein
MGNLSIYQQVKAAGCEWTARDATLCVKSTTIARKILGTYLFQDAILVRTDADGTVWLDVLWAYDPWWTTHRDQARCAWVGGCVAPGTARVRDRLYCEPHERQLAARPP